MSPNADGHKLNVNDVCQHTEIFFRENRSAAMTPSRIAG
jgi:hypothetical protein